MSTTFRKGLYEHGIRFAVFTRNDEDCKRIEQIYKCRFIRWLD